MSRNDPSLNQLVNQFRALFRSAYKLAPLVVILIAVVAFGLVSLTIQYAGLIIAVLLLLVVAFALIVFVTTKNYGEAALSLAAGLFSVYSVEWDAASFIGFVVAWLGFSFLALLISSIQIAAKVEDIYRQAALRLAPSPSDKTYKPLEERLKEIGKKDYPTLGPIERAQALLHFSFRRIPIDSMEASLRMVATLTVLTQTDHLSVTKFVTDNVTILRDNSAANIRRNLNAIYQTIRDSSVPPEDFFKAFNSSRYLILSHSMDSQAYFELLKTFLEEGISPEGIGSYLEERIEPY